MNKLNLLLLALLVASALALVTSVHQWRQLVAASHRAQQKLEKMEGEVQRLEAERQLAGTARQVERKAREQLAMRVVTPAITYYEGQGAAQVQPSAAASQPAPPAARAASAAAPADRIEVTAGSASQPALARRLGAPATAGATP